MLKEMYIVKLAGVQFNAFKYGVNTLKNMWKTWYQHACNKYYSGNYDLTYWKYKYENIIWGRNKATTNILYLRRMSTLFTAVIHCFA